MKDEQFRRARDRAYDAAKPPPELLGRRKGPRQAVVFRVTTGGSFPTAAPGQYLCDPVRFTGEPAEGGPADPVTGGDGLPQVVTIWGGLAAVGDDVIANADGGRWHAWRGVGSGGAKSTCGCHNPGHAAVLIPAVLHLAASTSGFPGNPAATFRWVTTNPYPGTPTNNAFFPLYLSDESFVLPSTTPPFAFPFKLYLRCDVHLAHTGGFAYGLYFEPIPASLVVGGPAAPSFIWDFTEAGNDCDPFHFTVARNDQFPAVPLTRILTP